MKTLTERMPYRSKSTEILRYVFESFGVERRKTLKEKDMKGYVLKTEEVYHFSQKDPIVLDSAYTYDGKYIGDRKNADFLVHEKGISPETYGDNTVCSIGFCEKDGKWYGWSHRAIHGFGIGDTGEKRFPEGGHKDKPKARTLEQAKEMAIKFAESVA